MAVETSAITETTHEPKPVTSITAEIDEDDVEMTIQATGKPSTQVVQLFKDGRQGTAQVFEDLKESLLMLINLYL